MCQLHITRYDTVISTTRPRVAAVQEVKMANGLLLLLLTSASVVHASHPSFPDDRRTPRRIRHAAAGHHQHVQLCRSLISLFQFHCGQTDHQHSARAPPTTAISTRATTRRPTARWRIHDFVKAGGRGGLRDSRSVPPQRGPGAWPLVEGKDRSLHKTILLAIVNAVVV